VGIDDLVEAVRNYLYGGAAFDELGEPVE